MKIQLILKQLKFSQINIIIQYLENMNIEKFMKE